jgi:two-component system, sensor histidine kinase
MALIFDNSFVAERAASLRNYWDRFKWRALISFREVFAAPPQLNDEQKLSLQQRQLEYLGWGALFWILILVAGACTLAFLGEKESITRFSLWCIALAFSILPCVFLLAQQLIRPKEALCDRALTRRDLLWYALSTSAAFVCLSVLIWRLEPAKIWILEQMKDRSVPLIWWTALAFWMLPCVLFLTQDLIRRIEAPAERELTLRRLLWSTLLTFVAFVWVSAFWTLVPQPRSDGSFHLAKQIFLYLTILGQVFTVIFLCSSRMAIFTVIMIGIFIPFKFLMQPELIASALANNLPNPQTNMYTFFDGQIVVWFFVGLFTSEAQKRFVVRAIIAESEHKRANNFVATLSHDIKQPLQALALKLGTIKRKLSSESPLLADVLQLQQQTTALESLIRACLDLSRLEAGTWRVKIREVPLPALITKMVDQMQFSATTKGISLERRPIPACLIWTDPEALQRILQNLISNAIKYTPVGGDEPGRVIVECEERGDLIVITVEDNGIGIPTLKHKDIFREYVQIGNPERDREKGFGLGLSIVDRLVKKLNHEIKVESSEGHGSRFSILVRRAASMRVDSSHGPSAPEFSEPRVATDGSPNLKDTVVVLVEDDTASREALYELLIEWGCYVIAAESAEEAITKVRNDEFSSRPTFILSDYRLREGRSGLDAIAAVRTEIGSAIPAVIWSAESAPEILKRIAAAGIEMLAKPMDENDLLKLLKRHNKPRLEEAS